MKKYNLSTIMKRAWQFVKEAKMTISAGLKRAWAEAKKIDFHKIAIVAIVDKFGHTNADYSADDRADFYLTFKLWEKNGYKRVYANDYKNRSVGYIDCNRDNAIVTDYSFSSDYYMSMQYFKAVYNF